MPLRFSIFDAQFDQDRFGPSPVIPAAVPLGVSGEPSLQLGQALLDILRLGRGDHRNDAIHELRVVDCPLEGLVAAIRWTGNGDEMLDTERFEQRLLSRDDVAHSDSRKGESVGLARLRVDARAVARAKGRAQHVRGHNKKPVGVDRFTGPDQPVPPARQIAVCRIAPGCVMAAGVAVSNQRRVPAIGGEPAIGLVNDFRLGQDGAILQAKIRYNETSVLDGFKICGHRHHPIDARRLCHVGRDDVTTPIVRCRPISSPMLGLGCRPSS
jgi:hypothetical protein